MGGILIFEGEYLNGKKNGKCKEYNNFGKLVYEGEYENGEPKMPMNMFMPVIESIK